MGMKMLTHSMFVSALLFAMTHSVAAETVAPATSPTPTAPNVASPSVAPANSGKPAVASPGDEGLLREGLGESSHSQSAPVAVALPVPSQPKHATRVAHYRPRGHRHHVRLKPDRPRSIAVRSHSRRNPVVSFIYWWNGLVIRKLHTKVGTVMLGTVGAQS